MPEYGRDPGESWVAHTSFLHVCAGVPCRAEGFSALLFGPPPEPAYIGVSFRPSFQCFKVCVQLILGNAFPAAQFIQSPADFRLDLVAIRHQPLVPFAQNLQSLLDDLVRALISPGAHGLGDAVFLLGFELNGHANPPGGLRPLITPLV